ncbi:hypothetical protein GH714_016951 [Hevea brasiliensis]|uniref:Carboxypeptidase n=1 Tax=Hevea brasiliensis TaxID=3981 RepID=A0A6A6KC55_HEVBR|nr:hypothetical protein GH714_016951 [Hevea brasiliensis]
MRRIFSTISLFRKENPSEDPVVLWLNGGPGCSSFDGFVYEHGPFNYEEGQPKGSLPILHLNPYSWSKVSNIIYLDSPCGVGLSYSTNTSKYTTDDWHTAADTHTFLLKWFELYPEFINNPFYISGESYAGIYVPTLAFEVVQGINAGVQPILNLKDVQSSCYGNYTDPNCPPSIDKVYEALDGLNIYDILEPCYHDPNAYKDGKGNTSLPVSFRQLGVTERPLKVRKRMFGRAWPLRGQLKPGTLWPELAQHGSVMCFNDEIATAWLNDESVRKAIHAKPKSIAGPWELCSGRISYARFSSGSMLPYHKNLTTQGYRALIYSGDHDMCVPFTGTQAWTRSLGYKIVDEWRSWISNDQVAGYLSFDQKNLFYYFIVSERNPLKDPLSCGLMADLAALALMDSFMNMWLELYPEFVTNPFYIAGESYAGIYVPTLASEVVKGIKAGKKPIINFKGYLVGNGASRSKFDGINALLSFTHGMGLISDDIFEEIQSTCKGNYYKPTANCDTSLGKLDRSDEVATAWLNDESVRKAIHAQPKSIAGTWELCTDRIDYESYVGSMIPYHKNLTTQEYRALYTVETMICACHSLGLKHGLDHLDIRLLMNGDLGFPMTKLLGRRAYSPEYKPRESLDFYSRWLDGKPI